MDFTVVGSVLAALLIAIPAAASFFSREARKQRRENRRLRALVQELDVHLFALEREGWTRHGRRPPPRPGPLQALAVASEDDDDGGGASGGGASEGPDAGTDAGPGGGPRLGP